MESLDTHSSLDFDVEEEGEDLFTGKREKDDSTLTPEDLKFLSSGKLNMDRKPQKRSIA